MKKLRKNIETALVLAMPVLLVLAATLNSTKIYTVFVVYFAITIVYFTLFYSKPVKRV